MTSKEAVNLFKRGGTRMKKILLIMSMFIFIFSVILIACKVKIQKPLNKISYNDYLIEGYEFVIFFDNLLEDGELEYSAEEIEFLYLYENGIIEFKLKNDDGIIVIRDYIAFVFD